MFIRTIAAASAALLLAVPVTAHHDGEAARDAGIVVSHAYTVEAGATAHSINVFVTIENTNKTPAVLTAAEVDFAEPGVFQAPSVDQSGKMSIQEITALEIAPSQTLTMQPGGIHIVFHDVQEHVEAGDHFHAHLEFEGVGEIEIEVEVEHSDDEHYHEESVG
ncbi:copper chaperone PCu(A)C [Amaricoccus macauensis]|uniref:copper chaperone PCu(A)C n=1 Tax=Amaricoccus macauensis TaxID=57001 RepID=UPI003C7A6634